MTEDVFPSVRILAKDAHTIEVRLPEADITAFPTIPEKLHGQELPSFVLDWLVDTDEVGMMIQELLQAPTRSLCRIWRVHMTPDSAYTQPTKSYTKYNRPYFRKQFNRPARRLPDIRAFKDEAEESAEILGQPEGVELPSGLLDTIEMAKRVDVWLEKGRRVREWLEDQGLEEESWLPKNESE